VGAAGRTRRGRGPDVNFEEFSFGPEGARRAGGGARGGFSNLEDALHGMFGGGFPRGGGAGFAHEGMTDSGGHDLAAEVTVTLAEAAKGATRRVHLPTGKEVDVKIPAGLPAGKQIRLKGQGLPGPGGIGDVLITVKVAPHPFFKVDGADLRIDLPITLYEAVLGGKVRVPTLDGAVELNIPAGTSGGRTFRIAGKGMPADGRNGDLFAAIRIALPEKGDGELEELMRRWRDQQPYDPRTDLK
jgi:DnaJ-class molecular chaperone